MLTEINRIKQNSIFKNESDFFVNHKDKFTESLIEFLIKTNLCNCCILNKSEIAENFYNALFNPTTDCFSRHICWLKDPSKEMSFFFTSLMYEMIEAFIKYRNAKSSKKTIELIKIINSLQNNLLGPLSDEDKIPFDVSPYMAKKEGINYLHNMYKLGRNMRFIIHTGIGTAPCISYIEQIGQYSAVIKISDEQMTMLTGHSSAFILKNGDDEKNFSVKTKILCAKDNTIIIDNINELETCPLLSRKFPRAAIVHASLVHIANEEEYITGNMLDISEGGMGIMSAAKSRFEKGQNIVAFVSYEDEESGFKFNFEANGIITSIIGKENVFRYGIQLFLSDEEKDMVHNLVEILSVPKNDEE